MPIRRQNVVTTWQRLAAASMPWMRPSRKGRRSVVSKSTVDREKVPPTEHDVLVDTGRWWNSVADTLFYNVEPRDEESIVEFKGMQGSIVCVWRDKKDAIQYPDAHELLQELGGQIEAIAVAGVGSSALGAAAFARDVAAGTGARAVAAVVSGTGMNDIVYEGLGGALFLREDNQLEFWFEKLLHSLPSSTLMPWLAPKLETWDCIGCGPDVVTLKSLLRPRRLKNLKWVVGHSKGNLVISSALSELWMEGALERDHLADVNFVMLSAIVNLPPVGKPFQVIGALDGFGAMNSQPICPDRIVPGAWHHLNRAFPFHLDAVKELATLR